MDKKKESSLTIKFKEFYQDVNGVTFFKILVYDQKTEETWEFEERYSAMRDIHKTLREQCKADLPDFPTKKWFGNTDKNFLSQRKATLQTYFTTILSILDIQKYPILKNFFYRKPAKQEQKPKQPQTEIRQEQNKQNGEEKSVQKPKAEESNGQKSNNQNAVVSDWLSIQLLHQIKFLFLIFLVKYGCLFYIKSVVFFKQIVEYFLIS